MSLEGKTLHMDITEEETNAIYYLLRKFNLLQESINIVDSVAVTGKYGKYTWNTSTGKLDITDCEPTTNYKIIFSILNTSTKAIRTVEANSNVSSSNTASITIPTLQSNEILQTNVNVEITYPQYIQVNPYQITVTADKPIIQADETATLTAQLTHNGSAVTGKTLSYKILHGSTVIDSGSDTTNNQGKITITYTGTAIGEVDLVISYGMLLQETFVLYDCIAIDNGTIADHNDSIWNSLVGVTRDDEYTVFNSTGAVNRFVQITGDVAIELDVMTTMASGGQLFRINQSGTTLSAPSVGDCEMTANTWKHIILRIKDNMLSIDDTSISDVDVTGFNQFRLRSAGNTYTYFKNLRIYSI